MIETPKLFHHENIGGGAIVSAIRDAFASTTDPGQPVWIVVADHPNFGREVYAEFGFGAARIDGHPCLRYLGERNSPVGASSSSVIGSGCRQATDVAELAAIIALQVGRAKAKFEARAHAKDKFSTGPWVFRGEAYRAFFAGVKS